MIAAATALALWSQLLHPWSSDFDVNRSKPAKGWTLVVRGDKFTGAKTCQITARDMSYRHGVLTFHFDRSIDTANALWRIDEAGAVRSVGVVGPEAAGLGAQFKSDNTRNPSNGTVHIPTAYLESARFVSIRPTQAKRARMFSLTGFSQTLAAAKAQGCDVV